MIQRILLALYLLSLCCNYSFAQQTIPKDALITLERDQGIFGAFHPYPYYKLTISSDGKVQLEPKSYNQEFKPVPKEGIRSQINKQQLEQIIDEFEKIDFYSLNSTSEHRENSKRDCPQIMADSQSATTFITINGKSKKVEHYHGCLGTEALGKLTILENKIDEIVNTKQLFECYFRKSI